MRVSIIIPIYGVENYIENCAISLFNQTYRDCEYIFVNDCTKDNSMNVLNHVIERYPARKNSVHIVNHSINMGLACARNTGVRLATGQYVMHVDSDDTIEKNTVELCVNKILECNADAVIFGMLHKTNKGDFVEHVSVPLNHTEYIKQLITRKTLVCMCGGVYKRSLYTNNNVWAIPGLNMGEDYSTKPRLLYYAQNVVALDMPLYIYNHLNDNSYTQKFNTNRIDNIQWAIETLNSFFFDCKDFSDYQDSLKEAALLSKLILLKSWAVSDSNRHVFSKIKILFGDIDKNILASKFDRMLLVLADYNQTLIIRIIVNVGLRIKSLLR